MVSTGAGGISMLTNSALEALNNSQIIVGYDKYIEDISSLVQGKKIYSSGMTKEIERCNLALEFATQGKTVAIISNGDVNVYGMATLIFELAEEKRIWQDVEIISLPGVTSFLAAASLCGAPVSQDFAVISLSDRLTPFERIDKKIQAALAADFVLAIYNPLSRSRKRPFENFLSRLHEFTRELKQESPPIIIAKNVGRKDQQIYISDCSNFLKTWQSFDIDMSTVLIVGNSQSRFIDDGTKILTPRGYLQKYDSDGKKK